MRIPTQTDPADVDDRYTVLGQVAPKQPGQHRQKNRLGIPFNDEQPLGKEQAGFGDVQETT
ncbi:hypothetical protein D3C80_1377040 [compost metagenome]